jgi:hypothetical protein
MASPRQSSWLAERAEQGRGSNRAAPFFEVTGRARLPNAMALSGIARPATTLRRHSRFALSPFRTGITIHVVVSVFSS